MKRNFFCILSVLSLLWTTSSSAEGVLFLQNNGITLQPTTFDYNLSKVKKVGYHDTRFPSFESADLLLDRCPNFYEIKQIESSFTFTFEQELYDRGLMSYECQNYDSETSILLSIHNIFRLMKHIPFDQNLSWAPGYDNLFQWLRSLNLMEIHFFWGEDNEMSYQKDGKIFLKVNSLTLPRYRKVIDEVYHVGLIDFVILTVHEAWHYASGKGHDCNGIDDSSLAYNGAWAVQYYLGTMLAENTGTFFSPGQQGLILSNGHQIYNSRFCYQ